LPAAVPLVTRQWLLSLPEGRWCGSPAAGLQGPAGRRGAVVRVRGWLARGRRARSRAGRAPCAGCAGRSCEAVWRSSGNVGGARHTVPIDENRSRSSERRCGHGQSSSPWSRLIGGSGVACRLERCRSWTPHSPAGESPAGEGSAKDSSAGSGPAAGRPACSTSPITPRPCGTSRAEQRSSQGSKRTGLSLQFPAPELDEG
jgi:hypothetical protein